jgi:hypothetical protein
MSLAQSLLLAHTPPVARPHVLVTTLQAGVLPLQAVAFVAVHCTQLLVAVLQTGVPPGHVTSPTH